MKTTSLVPPDVDSYSLVIKATDTGSCCGQSTRLTSSVTFEIIILDINKNKPDFTDCESYNQRAEVKELSPVGTSVFTVILLPLFVTFLFGDSLVINLVGYFQMLTN